MKKTISILLAVITLLLTPIAVTATTKSDVKDDIKLTSSYLYSSKTNFTVSDSVDFLRFIRANGDTSSLKNGYINSVKDALDTNGGKLLYYGEESAYLYGAVIECLIAIGENPSSFYSYNIVSTFTSFDFKTPSSSKSANIYKIIFEAIRDTNTDKAFAKEVFDYLVSNYTMGKGYDYWGYSCDNLGHFLSAMSVAKELLPIDAEPYITDGLSLIENYKKDLGYFSDSTYGTSENSDSTAEALLAYSTLNNSKKEDVYILIKGFSLSSGAYEYTKGDGENKFATTEVLDSLIAYEKTLKEEPIIPTTTTVPTTSQPTTSQLTTTESTTKAPSNSLKISSASAIKKTKKVTVKINKVSGANGYQIKLSTDKNFKNNVYTKNVTKTSNTVTYSKMSKNKKGTPIYAKVRSYTIKNGKKVYSKWSVKKAVKVK